MILGKDGSIFDDRRKRDRRNKDLEIYIDKDRRKEDRRKESQKTTHD